MAGLAGVIGLALLVVQPLLAAGRIPGLPTPRARHAHRWLGAALIGLVVAHVAGLWITSPPDVIDALLFSSPTPFSLWGVIAMWAVFATGALAVWRRRLHPRRWRLWHTALALIIIPCTVAHALLIEGTMGPASKTLLCALALAALALALHDLRVWRLLPRRTR